MTFHFNGGTSVIAQYTYNQVPPGRRERSVLSISRVALLVEVTSVNPFILELIMSVCPILRKNFEENGWPELIMSVIMQSK